MASSWFWPPSGLQARGVACVPYAAGLAVPDWIFPRFFPFTPGVGFGYPITLGSSPPAGASLGISAAAPDGSGGAYFVGYGGTDAFNNSAWHVSSGGVSSLFALPSGRVYVGAAFISPSGYVLSADGRVMRESGPSTFSDLAAWPSGVVGFTSSGSTLFSVSPSGRYLLTMTTGGVSGSIAVLTGINPRIPSCVATIPNVVVVGSTHIRNPFYGANAAAMDPQNATLMLAVRSSSVSGWFSPSDLSENWQPLASGVTGTVNLTAVTWRPDGTQAIAASVTSGVVQVIGYSAGILSLVQSLSVSGACSVAVASSSTNALVAQSGQSRAAALTYTGTWAAGTPVTGLPGICALASFGPTGVVAAVSGGVTFLGLVAGTWNILNNVPLGFTPTTVAVDQFLQVYAAGSGALSVMSGSTITGTGTWAGSSPTAIAIHDGRVVMAIPSDGLTRVFGNSAPGAWTQQSSATLALGAQVNLALSRTTLFTMGSGATTNSSFSGTPYTLTPIKAGDVSIMIGSGSWNVIALGQGPENFPSSIAFDASNTIWVSTEQNTIHSITTGGVVLTSGAIPVFSGQTQTTPLGTTAVCPASGHVYVATSLSGVLVEVS